MRYNDMVGLFDPARGQLGKDDILAKQALIDLINIRGLGALRCVSSQIVCPFYV